MGSGTLSDTQYNQGDIVIPASTLSQMQNAFGQVQSALNSWRNQTPSLPDSFSYNNTTVSKTDIELLLQECLGQLSILCDPKSDVDQLVLAVHLPGIIATCQQLAAIASSNPSAAIQNIPGLINNSWGLKSSLSWVLPVSLKDGAFAALKLKDVEAKAKTLRSAVSDIFEIKQSRKLIETSQAEIAGINAAVQSAATKVEEERKEIEGYTKSLKEIIKEQSEELEKFRIAQDKIAAALQGASQMGLATSFMKEHARLADLVVVWEKSTKGGFFALGVVAIFELVLLALAAFRNESPDVVNQYIPYLLSIVSPVIFWLWYSIRQRGIYRNLAEDYAFKQATALSFYGYSKEVEDDLEMHKRLREVAIENFGANPTRMLQKHEPMSPLHDGLDPKKFEAITKLLKDMRDIFK